MSTYDPYETVEAPRRHKHHHHRHDRDRDRDYDSDRYVETRETYLNGPATVPDPPYSSRGTEIVRRSGREDSDISIEEVRRDFPPPGAASYVQSRSMVRDDRNRYDPLVRSRSADRGAMYLADQRDDYRSHRRVVKEDEVIEPRRHSLSRNKKIIAGVAGAALAVGGKELWDRRDGQAPEKRNLLGTAAIGAAGAFAGYEGAELYTKKFGKEEKVKEKTYAIYQGRNGQIAEYYSSESDVEKADKKKSRRKSIIEGALGLAGLGAAAKAAGGRDDRSDRSGDRRSHRRDGSADSHLSRRSRRDRSRGPGGDGENLAKVQQAAKAALLAGAAEAFRVRKEPGAWTGAKGKRILTAAIGAGGIDAAAQDKDPDRHSKRHILEAVVGGLAGNRLINGSRNDLDDGKGDKRSGRSRSRSRAQSSGGGTGAGLAALATAGLGAFAGKKLLDRSKSRDRDDDDRSRRRRSPSPGDSDQDKRRRHRSKSVTDYARKGLAALGIGEAARDDKRNERREVDETRITHKSHKSRRGSDDDYYDTQDRNSRDNPYNDSRYADSRSSDIDRRRRKDGQKSRNKGRESDVDSLGSSSGDEKRVKKMRAHNVYQSFEKREARRKAVEQGHITHEEARKLKAKAQLQDLASIGIAALGIKGAVSEWKEMNDMRHEFKEFEEEKDERHKKRLERQKRLREQQASESGSTAVARRPSPGSDSRYALAPDLRYDDRYDQGPYNYDGPYASGGLPAPPMGHVYYDRQQ